MTFAGTVAVVALCDARCIWAQKSKSAFLPSSFLRPSFNLVRLSRPPGLVPGLVHGLVALVPTVHTLEGGGLSNLTCAGTRISVGMISAYVDASGV